MSIASIISIVLFIETYLRLTKINAGYSTTSIAELIGDTAANRGNKNVFSALILYKLPFVFYCIVKHQGWKKYFFMLVLFVASFTLFVLSTRALILGYFIMVVLFLTCSFAYKLSALKNSIMTLLVVGFALLIGLFYVKNNTIQNSELFNRNMSINLQDESLNIRFKLWLGALETIKENPATGCGLGSWKVESMGHEYKWKTNYTVAYHNHNDFLEVCAESGILVGCLYLSVFGLLFYSNLIRILSHKDKDIQLISTILLMILIGFGIDSFFNFPLYSIAASMGFVFLICFTLALEIENTTTFNSKKPTILLCGLLLILGISTLYPHHIQDKFYANLQTILGDVNQNLSSEEVSKMLDSPFVLDNKATPKSCIVANYLIKEEKYKEAIAVLDQSFSINPNTIEPYRLKIIMFLKTGNTDSINKYRRIYHEKLPHDFESYKGYLNGLAYQNDAKTILEAFGNINQKDRSPDFYAETIRNLQITNYDSQKTKLLLEEAIALYPDNDILKKMEVMQKKSAATPKKQSSETVATPGGINFKIVLNQTLESLKLKPDDIVLNENAAVCYYQLKEYRQAIPYCLKVINSRQIQTGKTEYIAAICYHFLSEKANSCQYAKIALERNFTPIECKEMIRLNCK